MTVNKVFATLIYNMACAILSAWVNLLNLYCSQLVHLRPQQRIYRLIVGAANGCRKSKMFEDSQRE